jgi:hypothetical protein
MFADWFARLFVLALAAAAAAAPVVVEPAPAPPAVVVELAPLCADGTHKIPVGPAGELGCPGPAAVPGPVGVPPGFTPVPWPEETAPPADPCFREDPECYEQ